jgi:hypothetical protein
MKIFVDIDGTICDTEINDYPNAKPIKENIAKINKLYDAGNEITYWTARGQSSCVDWTETTNNQLNIWGCKYHKLLLTKPGWDLLIDDRTKRIEEI